MAIAFVNRAAANSPTGGGVLTGTTNAFVLTAGNFCVVFVSGQSVSVPTIRDTAGNTWLPAGSRTNGGGGGNYWSIHYAFNCLGHASNVVTATFPTNTAYIGVTARQFSGMGTGDPYQDFAAAYFSGTTSPSTRTLAIGGTDSLIVAATEDDNQNPTAATGYTSDQTTIGYPYFADAYHLVSAAEPAAFHTGGAGTVIVGASFTALAPAPPPGTGDGACSHPTGFDYGFASCPFGVTRAAADGLRWGLEFNLPDRGWTNVSADVRDIALTCEYGIDGFDPTDRVASYGALRFSLNNSEFNSAKSIGYYSPFHVARRYGFDYDLGVRFFLIYGATRRFKHVGKLADIQPVPGEYGPRVTACQSLDWMDDAARIDVPDLAAQTGLRGDQVVSAVLAAMTTPPVAQQFDAFVDTLPYALDGGTGQRLKVREELNKVALSEQSYLYLRGDDATGGVLRAEKRGARIGATTRIAFDDDMARDGLVITGARDDVYSSVQVTVHPTVVDGAATTVLFALNTTTTYLAAGATLHTIFGPYRNPATNDPCGGVDMVTPAATTDYTMNAAADGSSTDLTAALAVTASYTGQGVRYTLVNTGGTGGYVTRLQARGRGVYRTTAVVERTVPGSYGDRVLVLDLPYQTSINVATSVANYYATILGTPAARVRSVTFLANRSSAFLAAAVEGEPGDQIAITETVTGLTNAVFNIQKVHLELQQGGILKCTWDLMPAGLDPFWVTASIPDPTVNVVGASTAFAATGGAVTTGGGFTTHVFTSASDTFVVTAGSTTVEVGLVAAGGSGGGLRGGGGGGGGVTSTTVPVTAGSYPITVGQGSSGANGGNTTAFGVTVLGGGKGADDAGDGSSGGSGGGAAGAGHSGGAGTSAQGYTGGAGASDGSHSTGGGGGGAGSDGNDAGGGGARGGPGKTLFGAKYGGGGGGNGDAGSGDGQDGGGTGGAGGNPSTAGTDGKGGGGGGGESKRGGHGTVIVRYPSA